MSLALFVISAGCSSDRKAAAQKVSASDLAADTAGQKAGEGAAAGSGKASSAKAPAVFAAHPIAEPPPAPVGAVVMAPPKGKRDRSKPSYLYVQSCDDEHACPKLLQTEAEIHCRKLALGVRGQGWRLPSRHEADRFGALAGLESNSGYHWTRTPFEQDMMQVWIVDPSGEGQSTTIPRTRKPFTARCVLEP